MTVFRLDRALIRIAGPDAWGFLDNLVTQDLRKRTPGRAQYAALLSPQGKVVTDMMVWAQSEDALLVDAPAARGGELMRKLTLFKLRAELTLTDISQDTGVIASDATFEGARPDPRLATLGFRAVAPLGDHAPGDSWFRSRRIDCGVPDVAEDAAPEEAFALEALLEELNGVDFQKGCFVGQENVSRMKRRATTRRKFCPVVYDGPPPPAGTSIMAGEAELGSVRGGQEGRAIALLRLDRALEAQAAGLALRASETPVALDPPPWLLLPQREAPSN